MTAQRVHRADMAAFPSKCLTCGSPAKPSVVFDVVQDWTGRMIICIECLTDAASQFCDVVPAARLREAEDKVAGLVQREERFDRLLSEFNEGIARVSASFYRDIDAIIDDSSGTLPLLELSDGAEDSQSELETDGDNRSEGPSGVPVDHGVFGANPPADGGIRPL